MKLLIVEDEQKLALSIQKGLKNENFATDVAFTGNDGLSRIHINKYDLIILDLMLPGIDGLSILKKIREEGNTTPVLILTAKGQLDDIVAGLNLGSDDYLTKPFSFQELVARIHALIRRATQSTPVIALDGLEVDTIHKKVTRNGKKIQLTRTEYSILLLLASSPDRYFSETELLESIWDSQYEGMSNVVRVHVRNLRSKVDRPFPELQPLITTGRGMGYKINSPEPK